MTSCSSISIQKTQEQRSKSCDTVCSSNSVGCVLQKKKPLHPLAVSVRTSYTNNRNSNVRQRILSAKMLKLRSLQSQINDANFHLNELQRENITLKTLNQRQEKALSKYEGMSADLPRLIKSHSDELRVYVEKNKTLRKTIRDLTDLIKTRDDELLSLKRQLDHLDKLNKNKHLGERQKLSDNVEDLKQKLETAERTISTLNRRLLLEEKTSRQKLSVENIKHKECQKNLMQALGEIERLTGLVDVNHVNSNKREDKFPLRKKLNEQSKSLISLEDKSVLSLSVPLSEPTSGLEEGNNEKILTIPPISLKTEENCHLTSNGEIVSPTENVKARLSLKKQDEVKNAPQQKLEKISTNIDWIIQKSKENGLTEFDRTIGDYCNRVMDTVQSCSKVVENHQESLDQSKNDTKIIMDAVDEIDNLDNQLKKNSLFSIDATELKKLLKPDNSVEKKIKQKKLTNKKKKNSNPNDELLAILRAVDNGEFINNFDENTSTEEIYDTYTN